MRSVHTMPSFFVLSRGIAALSSSPRSATAAGFASRAVLSSENRPSSLCPTERSVSKKDLMSMRPKNSSWSSRLTPVMTNSFSKNPDLRSKAEKKKKRNPNPKNPRDSYKINLLKSLPPPFAKGRRKYFPLLTRRACAGAAGKGGLDQFFQSAKVLQDTIDWI